HAVWGMARTLCPDRARASIAVGAAILVLALAGSPGQIAAIAAGAGAGLLFCRNAGPTAAGRLEFPLSRRAGAALLAAFFVLLVGLPLVAAGSPNQALAYFDAFYRAGALVFGGGHVVLPLLEAEVVRPGWTDAETFLAGYGATQAAPGPIFAFAAYLGAVMEPAPNGVAGAALCLVAIFLPGLLLMAGALPFW